MKRIIILAAAIAATTAAPLAGATLAADSSIARTTIAAASTNAELTINVTGDRRGCGNWYFQWKVHGNLKARWMWMKYCRITSRPRSSRNQPVSPNVGSKR